MNLAGRWLGHGAPIILIVKPFFFAVSLSNSLQTEFLSAFLLLS